MNICVYGLWHLGSVTAACLAEIGHNVIGLDKNEKTALHLHQGKAPISEPGLDDLIQKGYKKGNLSFTTNTQEALENASVLWICADTPINDKNEADPEIVISDIKNLLSGVNNDTLIIVSSQLPVGSLKKIEDYYQKYSLNLPLRLTFAIIPENLRLGQAIKNFLYPDRLVIGTTGGRKGYFNTSRVLNKIFPIPPRPTVPFLYMSPESAEMVKHATNAWLATSITFANEIAAICEKTGADYRDVEIALKNDSRIGDKAYIKAGLPYSGGTLARDIGYLEEIHFSPLFHGVNQSNHYHESWVTDTLIQSGTDGPLISILGLTYKTGTDTQRCSLSKDLINDLNSCGFVVYTHDPSTEKNLPQDEVNNSQAVIIMTQHPEYQKLTFKNQIVIDPNGFLRNKLEDQKGVKYYCVGKRK